MTTTGEFTRQEIFSQPEAWTAALAEIHNQADSLRRLYHEGNYEHVLFTGCGSTYYLSLAAAAMLQEEMGVYARAMPASEIWLYPRSAYLPNKRTLLVAVSRSGETTETVRAVEAFKKHAMGDVLTLSCYPGRDLASAGKLNLLLTSGQEQSVAQTRAFSVLYLATIAVIALWKGDEALLKALDALPPLGRRLLTEYEALAQQLGRDPNIERFYLLGSGPRYGLASELSLKLKEMSLSHSEPFTFMEFRHGPQSMVNANTLIVGLRADGNRAQENAVLEEMRVRGAQILCMDESEADVTFGSKLSQTARSVLYLPVGQMMAFEHALMRGLNPDRPHNLEAVVKLG